MRPRYLSTGFRPFNTLEISRERGELLEVEVLQHQLQALLNVNDIKLSLFEVRRHPVLPATRVSLPPRASERQARRIIRLLTEELDRLLVLIQVLLIHEGERPEHARVVFLVVFVAVVLLLALSLMAAAAAAVVLVGVMAAVLMTDLNMSLSALKSGSVMERYPRNSETRSGVTLHPPPLPSDLAAFFSVHLPVT